ncbi:MAG: UDP-N-acetylmuramoyl-L-alanyl-D-glutamate--2,6-diaminopimelate ligase [Candidatus Sumerlaeia bacterium]
MSTPAPISLKELWEKAGLAPAFIESVGDVRVMGVTEDSRHLKPGDIFVAVSGEQTDGHLFVPDAVYKGASVVIAERTLASQYPVPVIVMPDPRQALGRLAQAFYDNPSRSLYVIGITGTNGKTTTTFNVRALFEAAGIACGVIGTLGAYLREHCWPLRHTTPPAVTLARTLAEMRDKGAKAVVMEVSSHAIVQERIAGVRFDAGLLTNISADHRDYHKSWEAYIQAKWRFFQDFLDECKPRVGLFNLDDPKGAGFARIFPAPCYTYGLSPQADYRAEAIQTALTGTHFSIVWGGNRMDVETPLFGLFNVYNALAAAAVCLASGLPPESVREGLRQVAPPEGRFERVHAGQDFYVFVDYAHSPDAMSKVLSSARSLKPRRIITVFGAGGDRDQDKRPIMGRIAAEYSDHIIVTTDNPRNEDPMKIAREIVAGLPNGYKGCEIILDRRQAIAAAIDMAATGDLVLICGKGHEATMTVGNQAIPFSDREVALTILAQLGAA